MIPFPKLMVYCSFEILNETIKPRPLQNMDFTFSFLSYSALYSGVKQIDTGITLFWLFSKKVGFSVVDRLDQREQ